MPPKQRGLGPLGRSAVERAAESHNRAPQISESPNLRNEAALTIAGFREAEVDDTNVDDLEWYVFDSSRVAEAAYKRKEDRLYVRWQDGGTGYVYEGVPANEWRNFKRSQSPGRFVNRVLNGHEYHRGNF